MDTEINYFRWLTGGVVFIVALVIEIITIGKLNVLILFLNLILFLSTAKLLKKSKKKLLGDEDFIYQCSECNSEVKMDDKVCPDCGADLSVTEADYSLDVEGVYVCPDCKRVFDKLPVYCTGCGYKF